MQCSQCFHCSVCGSSSPYSDASQCKSFVSKDSLVSIDVFHSAQDKCEKLREDYRDVYFENHNLKEAMEEKDEELRQLRVIKQTLEMSSGMKFNF